MRPSIALSDAQMAALTSDIVWLVEREVTLPDGTVTRALVPQVYVRPRAGDLDGTGTLISARNIDLQVSGDVINSGTLGARRVAILNANNLRNLGGTISGTQVGITAKNDIDNIGGSIIARDAMFLDAGRDINLTTTTQSAKVQAASRAGTNTFTRTTVDRVAGLYVTGADGKAGVLVANAGRDINLSAALINNSSAASSEVTNPDGTLSTQSSVTALNAGRDLSIGTVRIESSDDLKLAGRRYSGTLGKASSEDIGSQIGSQGSIQLQAGQDISTKAASIAAGEQLSLAAGRDIRIEEGQATQANSESSIRTSRGFLSRGRTTAQTSSESTTAIASSLGGKTILIDAGRDLTIKGSEVISDQGTTLLADRDITITAAQNTSSSSSFQETRRSGIMSGGGFGVFIGSKTNSTDVKQQNVTQSGSTIAAIDGNVTILAGNNAKVQASNILTPGGDVTIIGKNVEITDLQNTNAQQTETKSRQSGLTVSVSSPLISAADTVVNSKRSVNPY